MKAIVPRVCGDTCPCVMNRPFEYFLANGYHILNKMSVQPHALRHVTKNATWP
ncbi:hypothetical protein Hanom_Chr13g01186841 [Helianthus anomalus]